MTDEQAMYEAERERRRQAQTTVTMTVQTRVPSKYRLLDLETGNVWKWNAERGSWTAADLPESTHEHRPGLNPT